MPFIVVPLFVLLPHGIPGYTMSDFFTVAIAATFVRVFVFVIGAVKGFTVNVLGVRWQNIFDAIW